MLQYVALYHTRLKLLKRQYRVKRSKYLMLAYICQVRNVAGSGTRPLECENWEDLTHYTKVRREKIVNQYSIRKNTFSVITKSSFSLTQNFFQVRTHDCEPISTGMNAHFDRQIFDNLKGIIVLTQDFIRLELITQG